MSIDQAINNILENNLQAMKENFNTALYQKAAEKLEEKKIDVASNLLKTNQE